MVGHLLEYHPGRDASSRRSSTRASSATSTTSTRNRLNLGQLRDRRERALEPRRARRLGAPAPGRRRGAVRAATRAASPTCATGVEDVVFCFLRFPSGPGRAPAPLVARPAQGAPLHGRRRAADGDVRRHGPRAQGHGLRQGLRRDAPAPTASTSPARATSGARRSRPTSRCGSSASTSSSACARARTPRSDGEAGVRVVRVLEALQQSLEADGDGEAACCGSRHDAVGLAVGDAGRRELGRGGPLRRHVIVHNGTVIGDGCVIEDGARARQGRAPGAHLDGGPRAPRPTRSCSGPASRSAPARSSTRARACGARRDHRRPGPGARALGGRRRAA